MISFKGVWRRREIRVLTSAVCAMLNNLGLPKSLWAEAYNTATYVRNRTLTSALDGRTPYEMVYGVKPDLADLRAFGALCAIVKPGVNLQKLDDCAIMCISIGYKYGGGGYRVWDLCKSMVVFQGRTSATHIPRLGCSAGHTTIEYSS